jgi:ribosomal protein S18 acetylase RimI-like enzyme
MFPAGMGAERLLQGAGIDVIVRRLAADDVGLLRGVRLAALEESPDAFGESLEAAQRSDWEARTASGSVLSDRAVFVALAAEEAIGMVFVRGEPEPKPAFLGGMWVDPRFRHLGVGRGLVGAGLDFLRSIGQRRVNLWVTSAHTDVLRFYRSLGFRETGAVDNLRPGSPLSITELELSLEGGDAGGP